MSIEEVQQIGLNDLAATFAEGISNISQNQTVTFNLYVRLVLPLDGYVFWVKSTLLIESALYNVSLYNQFGYNVSALNGLPRSIVATGSLHYQTELKQTTDDYGSRNYVIFTTQEQIQDFELIGPNLIYIAEFDKIKFAFSKTANFYKQAQVYHYRGVAIFSLMKSQVIDSIENFDTTNVIVSNSLPLWLFLNQYFPVFPAFLSVQNAFLPYATVYIDPKTTHGRQLAPLIKLNGSHYQLTSETVKIQITGIRNNIALEYLDYVLDYSRHTDNFGLLNTPIVEDEHLQQIELGLLAQRKSITFEISYYQQNILNIAQKLILSAGITLNPQ